MGRPPSNGGPSFRFNPTEVAEMEAILQAHNTQVPSREILVSLAEKFSNSSDRFGKVVVQMKQVWNWFQNRRYALRAKAAKVPAKLSASPVPSNDVSAVRNMPQAPQHMPVAPAQTIVRNVPQVLQPISSAPAVPSVGQNSSDSFLMEFEAKSARDGAWYDVATFISYRSADTTDPEVLVRFAGLGPEEDEWVNIRKHVRQRSLPCEASECVAVLPADLILCFQEGKEQALYFDAHVLDAQRRRHDVRGCRCRFLVRYDHDQSEEIVPLKKVCRRPETDYRMQQLHVDSANVNRNKANPEPHMGNTLVHPSSELSKKLCTEPPVETKDHTKAEVLVNTQPVQALITLTSACTTTAAVSNAIVGVNSAVIGTSAAQPVAPIPTSTMPIAQSNISGATVSAATTTNPDVHFSDSGATVPTVTAAVAQSITSGATLTASSPSNPVPQANASGAALSSVSTTNLASHFVDSGSTVSPVNATSTVAQNTRGATLPASTTTNATDQLIDSPATVFTVSTTPATTSVTHSISSGATSSPPAFQVIDFGANVSTVTAMPAILSTDSEASASTTTQDANSIVSESASSTVTATIPVADSDVGFTDSVITTTTSVPSSNLSGASDPAVPITTPTTTTDVSGAAEGTEATLVPGSAVSEITNPVPTEKPEK